MQTTTSFAYVRSEEDSNLILNVTEYSHFNSSACGFSSSIGSARPSYSVLKLAGNAYYCQKCIEKEIDIWS